MPMADPAQRRQRYRTDPAYRARILASNNRSRAKAEKDPRAIELAKIRSQIFQMRLSIDYHMRETELREKRLLDLLKRRDELTGGA